MEISIWEWAATIAFVIALFVFDLLKHRSPHAVGIKEATWSTIAWTVLGLLFVFAVLLLNGGQAASDYMAGYLLERTLSLDNVFVFVLILSFFAVPAKIQPRALLFGVAVALVLRAIFIFLGANLIESFEWMFLVFGGFLIFTAFKLGTQGDDDVDPDKNIALRLLRKIVPVSDDYDGNRLLTRVNAKRAVTPLFAVLLVIGTTDLIFAIDSIPAIFGAISEPDPYIVFTANALALLGLRPMTFLLSGVMERFAYLKYSLALVLGLIGGKMIYEYFGHHVHVAVTLAVIVVTLAGGILFSLYKTRNDVQPENPLP